MEDSLYISSFRRIIKASIFALLILGSLIGAVIYIGGVYSSVVNKNAVNEKSNRRFEDFYALPKNSLDIVFVGSSHSYCSFDPENFDSVLGTSSFQLGMPFQQPDATYYTLREVFNYQKPSLVVVEVYWDLLGSDTDMKQALTLFDSLNNQELEREYVADVFSIGEKIKYNIDIINYQRDYFEYQTAEMKKTLQKALNVTDSAQKRQGEEYYKSKGYVYCDYVILPDEFGRTNQFNGLDGRDYEVNDKQKKYLKMIVEMCSQNGAKVAFVTAPVANVSLSKISNYTLINEQVAKMANSFEVDYIDYNVPEVRGNMFTDSNFRDDAHLNDSGVKILDSSFIGWITERRLLP